MTATSGLLFEMPFATYDPDSSCWRTSGVISHWDSGVFSATWPTSGSMRNGACFERPTSASAMDEHACSSSRLMPTPAAADAERGPDYARMNREGSGGDDLVTTMHRLLPTPTASTNHNTPENHIAKKIRHGAGPVITDLTVMARQAAETGEWSNKLLPTPTVSDVKGPSPNHDGTLSERLEELSGGRMSPLSAGTNTSSDEPTLPL